MGFYDVRGKLWLGQLSCTCHDAGALLSEVKMETHALLEDFHVFLCLFLSACLQPAMIGFGRDLLDLWACFRIKRDE